MSEAAFHLFNTLYALTAEILYALCLALFLRPFLTRRQQGMLLALSGSLTVRLICDAISAPRGLFGLLLTALLVLLSGPMGLEPAMAFLLALLYWNARISGGLMAESLYFLADRAVPLPPEPPEAIFLRAAGMVTLFLLTHALLFAAMLYVLQRRLRIRQFPLCRRVLCCLSLVPAAGILFGQVISQLLMEFKDGVLLLLYERHPAFLAVIPVLAALFYAGAYLSISFHQGMAELQEEQAASLLEHRQTQALQARVRELEQFYAQVRGLKHDLRNHLANLERLARNGAHDSLEAYIARIDGSIQAVEQALQTGNPVTDVIVGDIRQRCLELGIDFQADFHYPESGGYDAFDLGILLQNLLQNAAEACQQVPQGQRQITLTGRRQGRFFLVEVQNSFLGTCRFGPNGLPVTTKNTEPGLHGIGLANVRRAAEKYLGELELKADAPVFTATVLLQERSCP